MCVYSCRLLVNIFLEVQRNMVLYLVLTTTRTSVKVGIAFSIHTFITVMGLEYVGKRVSQTNDTTQ